PPVHRPRHRGSRLDSGARGPSRRPDRSEGALVPAQARANGGLAPRRHRDAHDRIPHRRGAARVSLPDGHCARRRRGVALRAHRRLAARDVARHRLDGRGGGVLRPLLGDGRPDARHARDTPTGDSYQRPPRRLSTRAAALLRADVRVRAAGRERGGHALPGSAPRAPRSGGRHRRGFVMKVGKRVLGLVAAGVGLYVVWPSLVQIFSAWPQLITLDPWWLLGMFVCEALSFALLWLMLELALHTDRTSLVATTQLSSNAFGRVMPGGGAAAAAL